MGNGVRRFTNGTTGGPLYVYVKDGKTIRMTPIDLTEDDPAPWTIEARGHIFSPPHRMTINTHGSGRKALIYSKDRNLYPMRRVDFDPHVERNIQNRGTSGYERISWDEAYRIVTDEIRRVRAAHGSGSLFFQRSSHHTWGFIG